MQDRFELPAELNIYKALESRDALLAWLSERSSKGGQPLGISAANVVEVDGSGLQLLAALGNARASWQLLDASPVFADACRVMGLAQWLEDAQAQPRVATAVVTPKPLAKGKTATKAKSRKESAP